MNEITHDILAPAHIGALAVGYYHGREFCVGRIIGYERGSRSSGPYADVYFGYVPKRLVDGDLTNARITIGLDESWQLFLV